MIEFVWQKCWFVHTPNLTIQNNRNQHPDLLPNLEKQFLHSLKVAPSRHFLTKTLHIIFFFKMIFLEISNYLFLQFNTMPIPQSLITIVLSLDVYQNKMKSYSKN